MATTNVAGAPTFNIVAMPTDPVQKSLSATFQNPDQPNQSVSVYLAGATGDGKTNIKAALDACLKSLEAL